MTFATSALALLSAAPGETALPADSAPTFFQGVETSSISDELVECAGVFGQLLEPDDSAGQLPIPEMNEGDAIASADPLALALGLWPVQPSLMAIHFQPTPSKSIQDLVQPAQLQEQAVVVRWATAEAPPVAPANAASFLADECPTGSIPSANVSKDKPLPSTPAFSLLLRPAPASPASARIEKIAGPTTGVSQTPTPEVPSEKADPLLFPGGQLISSQAAPTTSPVASFSPSQLVLQTSLPSRSAVDWTVRPEDMGSETAADTTEPGDQQPAQAETELILPVERNETKEGLTRREDDSPAGGNGHAPLHSREEPTHSSNTNWGLSAERTPEQSAAETGPAPRPESSRTDRTLAPDTKIERPPQPVRELVVQLPGHEGRAVEIRFVDRKNAIEVTARTQRQQDAIPLQQNLNDLRERLAGQGFASEVMPSNSRPEWRSWLPSHEALPSTTREPVTAASASAQTTAGGSDGHNSGDNQRKGLAMWLNQVEESLDGNAEAEREESR